MNYAIREILHRYNHALADEGIIGKDHKGVVETPDTPMEFRLEHTRWMIIRLLEHPEEFDVPDRNIWIGFIQGVLWMNGNITLKDARKGWDAAWEEESL